MKIKIGTGKLAAFIISVTLSASFGMALAMDAGAAQLAPSKWTVTDGAAGRKVTEATDNNIDTRWTSSDGKGLMVDLGADTLVHRVYLASGTGVTGHYGKVRVSLMVKPESDPAATTLTYVPPSGQWYELKQPPAAPASGTYADLRFNPLTARYVRIEGAAQIAELEVYGSTDKAAFGKQDAVVVATNASTILRLAAEDLRYYIGELSGRPLPLIAPEQEGEYPGTLYKIVDLKPLAGTYEEMVANTKAGKLPNGSPKAEFVTYPSSDEFGSRKLDLPEGVNVEREGRSVLFKAWPYRNVAYSAWEFLRRQGVIWSAPEDHADYVPAGKGVDLSILPLRYQPTSRMRVGGADGYLDLMRNGYNEYNSLRLVDNKKEIPTIPQGQTRNSSDKDLKPEYKEGFYSSPHNLHAAIPVRLLEEHPDWCGMGTDGQRKPPSKGGPQTFCFTSPEVIQFVADKMVYWSGDNPDCAATFRLVPSDGATFCQCERCLALCKPLESPAMAYCAGQHVMSGPYYYFVTEVARRVKGQRPHLVVEALAYADYTPVPRQIEKFPDNTTVQVCVYGARNLPLSSSPVNADARKYLEAWPTRGVPLTHWDYLLIHSEWRTLEMPVPMVTAMADRARYLSKLGMWNGLCQADHGSFVHNPWNRYAHPRLTWNMNLTAEQVLGEFFTAYYREAAVPMLAYYKAFEDYLIKNNISLEDFAYDLGPNPDMFTPDLIREMKGQLDVADKTARDWHVKQRIAQARKDFESAVPAALRRSLDKAIAVKNGKKEYACGRRIGAITIDGKLDDEGWKAAPVASGFVAPVTFVPAPADGQTEYRMTWDDEKLYVGIRCVNTNVAALKPSDNAWGTGDYLEFFLVPERVWTPAYYQAAISSSGNAWGPQRFLGTMFKRDDTKLAPFETAASVGKNEWTCEIAVPFKTLGDVHPKAGDYWTMNIVRGLGNGSTWSRMPTGNWHLYRDFDFLTFIAADAGK